ncbi:hypothetical protein H5410_026768 [Solanum commersonii]|uniref:Sulfotransferase n=1 Tax=Solanum commersonii TaxID=4109 RepID=A0A9J5Z1K8_SOLCO|nr:hypothetical protein H5410_026768 [Solanum commersonii]
MTISQTSPPKYFQENDLIVKSVGNFSLPYLKKKDGLNHISTFIKVFDIIKSNSRSPFTCKEPHDLILFLKLDLYVDGQVPDFSLLTSPRLFSTHFTYASLPKLVKDSKTKLVYLYIGIQGTLYFYILIPLKKCLIFLKEIKEQPKIHLTKFLEYPFSTKEKNLWSFG